MVTTTAILLQDMVVSSFIILPTIIITSLIVERTSYNKLKVLSVDDRSWNLGIKLLSACCIVHMFNIVPSSSSQSLLEYMIYYYIRILICGNGILIGTSLQSIAITGGIACGKSSVSKIFEESNDKKNTETSSSSTTATKSTISKNNNSFTVIDLDEIAHDILHPTKLGNDSAYPTLIQTFGKGILEEETSTTPNAAAIPNIDRIKLGSIVFANKEKRKLLNSITHPLVFKIMMKRIFWSNIRRKLYPVTSRLYNDGNSTILTTVDIPLFYETGPILKVIFPVVIVIACNPSIQLQRLQNRNPELSQDDCVNRMQSQMPLDKKVKRANLIIWNNDDKDVLFKNVINVKVLIQNKILGYCDLIHLYILFSLFQFIWILFLFK